MEMTSAIAAFAALAQETRLEIFRLLVQAGPSGLPAGSIAERLGVPPSTLSHHLATLDRAGLLRSWRLQRQIFYAAEYEGIRRLLSFMMEDCCQGHPEICGGGPVAPLEAGDPAAPAKEASDETPAHSCRR